MKRKILIFTVVIFAVLCLCTFVACNDERHEYTYGECIWNEKEGTAIVEMTCDKCGQKIRENAYIERIYIVEPTCLQEGFAKLIATVNIGGNIFNKFESDFTFVVPPLGHDIKSCEQRTETCTEEGWDAYEYCTRCDYTTCVKRPALGHDEGEPVYVWGSRNSICTATTTCTRCNKEITKEQNNPIYNILSYATCTEDGLGEYTVNFKDSKFTTQTKTEVIVAKGHSYSVTDYKWDENDASKCTATRTCSTCATVEKETAAGIYSEKSKPTCTEAGKAEFVVTFENKVFGVARNAIALSPKGHKTTTVEAKAPTCTEIGWNEYEYCTRTGCDYTTYSEKAALGHNYATEFTVDKAATCTEVGSKSRHCSRCESTTDVTEVPALGHNTDGTIAHVDATCTEDGVVGGTYCTRCDNGKAAAEVTIPALGHNTDGTIAHKDATCTETGVVGGTYCTRCNYGKAAAEATIPALGHNTDGTIDHVDATCTETGVVGGKYCTRCNYGKAAATATIDALGHDYATEYTVDVPATCTEVGSKSRHCSRCDSTTDVTEVPALGHNAEGSITHKDATCTETGVVGGTYCTRCDNGKEAAEVTIPALGHNTDGTIDHVDATCTETGVVGGTYCTRCNNGKAAAAATIDALGHDYATEYTVDVPATCTEVGSKSRHCSRCDSTTDVTEVEALGHNTDGTIAHKDATCTEDGVVGGTYCTRCDNGKAAAEVAIPALGHTFVAEFNWTEYQCEAVTRTCSVCQHIEEGSVTVTDEVTLAPTCTETGIRIYTAVGTFGEDVYSDSKNEVLPANGHSYDGVVFTWYGFDCTADRTCTVCGHIDIGEVTVTYEDTVDATCLENGVRTYTASVTFDGVKHTNTKKDNDSLTALGHSYGPVSYVWTRYDACTASRTCKACQYVDTETVETVKTVTVPLTCLADGENKYTATFENEAFAEQTKYEVVEQVGHVYNYSTASWEGLESGDIENITCTIVKTCKNCDAIREELNGEISCEIVGFEGTCVYEYRAYFEDMDTMIVYLISDESAHNYRTTYTHEISYEGDEIVCTVTATQRCKLCGSRTIETKVATCTGTTTDEEGNVTYTFEVSFDNDIFEDQVITIVG